MAQFQPVPLEEQVRIAEQYQLESLLFCPDAWALRHCFINVQTGEEFRARCDRWSCLYCGPRKVDLWRRLVAEAEPKLHVVLTRVGWTVQDASRVLTTVLQYLRRGSKGHGRDHLGARPAYPVECFAVLEELRTFRKWAFTGICWSMGWTISLIRWSVRRCARPCRLAMSRKIAPISCACVG